MQSQKEKHYLKKFLERTKKSKEELSNFILENFEDMVKSNYAGPIELDLNEFVNIILVDACFIFELFSCYDHKEDFIMRTPLLFNRIKMDLIMLENQIPFSTLNKLYAFSKSTPTTFLELSMNFFGLQIPSSNLLLLDENSIKHFTDLHRRSWLPKEDFSPGKLKHLYTATKLDKAGVNFAPPPPQKDSTPLLNVEVFRMGRRCKFIPCLGSLELHLPLFAIHDDTEYILRNVMAMEQYQPGPNCATLICSYMYLMSALVDTEQDVDFLVEKKVIKHSLGSNMEVAEMINKIGKNMYLENFIYAEQCDELNEFYERWYNRAKATLIRVYFKDLWTGSSTVVGVFVLIFTIVSTIESIWSFQERSLRSANKINYLSFSL
ncbi:UPF0481 protein At3g47200-like [Humulus lupulus]|nr:UPF0481 protein At3g47200-like [Humulus lupulus]